MIRDKNNLILNNLKELRGRGSFETTCIVIRYINNVSLLFLHQEVNLNVYYKTYYKFFRAAIPLRIDLHLNMSCNIALKIIIHLLNIDFPVVIKFSVLNCLPKKPSKLYLFTL